MVVVIVFIVLFFAMLSIAPVLVDGVKSQMCIARRK
jgi:hypothetical protein